MTHQTMDLKWVRLTICKLLYILMQVVPKQSLLKYLARVICRKINSND